VVVGLIALAFLAKLTEISWFVLHKLLLQEFPPAPAPLAPPLRAALPALSACRGVVRNGIAKQAMIVLRMLPLSVCHPFPAARE
jgi:hypothetical protein